MKHWNNKLNVWNSVVIVLDQSYKAGRDEYNRLERMIEELKEKQK